MRKIYPVTLILLPALLILAVFFPQTASAITATDWKAGNIIDDSIFTDQSSMSVEQIQAFLVSKVGTGTNGTPGQCDTNGIKMSEIGNYSMTRAQYGANNSNPAPFTCLKDYYEVPKTIPSPGIPENNYGGKQIPAGAKSSAQLIWDAAQKYKISPKVLLVKIGTESAGPLTSDDWPFLWQYKYAMGSHCPDSGPGGSANCDENYAGFSIQMDSAASLLRWYLDSMTEAWWPYKKPYQNNSILWNVIETGCGAGNVFIDNKATAALYTYTPYQPNQAALNNMYGTGDGCSAYGNRNFWRTYNNWFGDTRGQPSYSYSLISTTAYSDIGMKAEISQPISIQPNSNIFIKLVIKNTGNQVWYKNTLRLGTESPKERSSIFATSSWLSASRPTSMAEESVGSNDTATFIFEIKSPTSLGDFQESFGILIEGQRWLDGTISVPLTVMSPTPYFMTKTISINAYSDIAMTKQIDTNNIENYTGSKIYLKTVIQNCGNQTLPANLTQIATANPLDHISPYSDSSWLSQSRVAKAQEGDIMPQKTGTFVFSLTSPGNWMARSQESFGLVIEGQGWLSENIGHIYIQTNQRPPITLGANQILKINESLMSSDESYKLVLQGDGNLVLYSPTRAIWASWTVGQGGTKLIMQSDGNLVLYKDNWTPIWDSHSGGRGTSKLIIQPDGNLVIYAETWSPTWHTSTHGQK